MDDRFLYTTRTVPYGRLCLKGNGRYVSIIQTDRRECQFGTALLPCRSLRRGVASPK